MDFSFFTTNNKAGHKTREKWLSTNHPEEYKEIINYSNQFKLDFSFKEKIWFYFNNLTERPKCITCKKEIKFRERFDIPYGEFCSVECINSNKEEMISRQKKTFNLKYNIDFYPQHKEFLEKRAKTKFERYGDENFNNLEKGKTTKLERYGSKKYVNTDKYKTTCLKKYGVDNYSKSKNFQKKINSAYKSLYPDIKFTKIDKLMVSIKCPVCEKEGLMTKQLLYERNKRGYEICIHCNPVGQASRSGQELKLSEFLSELNVPHERSNRSVLSKHELDIFIPDYKLAVEFDGLYWHNELFVTNDYHLNKTVECQEKGINLIHIFEDEWTNKKEIVKSIIKNKLNKTDLSIYARKCIIKEISSDDSKEFLDNNHIQGKVNSKIRLGLFYNDELVSVMTFSKGRVIMGGKKDEWELNRFCNKINTNVVGASGRLFNYFLKKYCPQKIVSYSDIRLFDGHMYYKLGFNQISQSKPNYWYIINGMRYYRFNFRKGILMKEGFDTNKTEKEIMFERKIYRIYDCGNIRWEFNT